MGETRRLCQFVNPFRRRIRGAFFLCAFSFCVLQLGESSSIQQGRRRTMKRILACFCFVLCAAFVSTPSIAERSSARSLNKASVATAHASSKAKKPKKKVTSSKKKRSPRLSVRALTAKQRVTIAVYEACMEGAESAGKDERIFRALDLAFTAQGEQPLRGSPDKLGTEICVAELLGLSPFESDDAIALATEKGELFEFSFDRIVFAPELALHRRAGRSWVPVYLNELTRSMSEAFPDAVPPLLRIPSVVRTKAGQQRLFLSRRTPARCDVKGLCSTHTSGAAIDISLRMLDGARFAWLTERLQQDIRERKILAILEGKGGHFHVFVLPPETTLAYRQSRKVLQAQR